MIIKNNDPYTEASFSIGNRLARLIWGIVWCIFFRWSPVPFHGWRAFLLKCFGAKIGQDVHFYPGCKVWAPWNLVVGDRVGVAGGVVIYNMDKISIGSNVVISQGAHLCAGSHDYESKNFQLIVGEIKVMDHVWICAEAFIGPNVVVPIGVVIGARSVVMRSVADCWTVWSGNPAQFIKNRKLRQ